VASSTASTTVATPLVIQTGFTDTIIENHDTRTLVGTDGAPQIMWTFIDRNTILIATDTRTVEEIISRLTTAPIKTSI
jgi:hypothetical protein